MQGKEIGMLLVAGLLTGCVWVAGPAGPELVVVPPLPAIVMLELEPFYVHGGFVYHYHGDRWSYARARKGPWLALPRDHYPREVRWKRRGRY